MRLRLLLLGSLGACAACVGVDGEGGVEQSSRAVAAFSVLGVRDALVVEVSRGAPSASLSGDRSLIEEIRLRVDGDRLDVLTRDGAVLLPEHPLVVRLTTPALEVVEVTEASVLRVQGVAGAALRVTAREGSAVRAEGAVDTLVLGASSVADVDTRDLTAREVVVDAGGAADLRVRATGGVRGRLTENAELWVEGGGSVEALEVERDAVVRRVP
jgi:hypothetical protein